MVRKHPRVRILMSDGELSRSWYAAVESGERRIRKPGKSV